MTTITKAPHSEPSRFQSADPAEAVENVTPFLAPPTPEDLTPVCPASDRGEQAMDRLRHPFMSE
jgi:hypothetical protein